MLYIIYIIYIYNTYNYLNHTAQIRSEILNYLYRFANVHSFDLSALVLKYMSNQQKVPRICIAAIDDLTRFSRYNYYL